MNTIYNLLMGSGIIGIVVAIAIIIHWESRDPEK
jgi:hypothetical protein